MVATHMVLGQTEKTLRMAPNTGFIRQRKTFSTVESLKYFQVRHSFYPSSRGSDIHQFHALAFLSAPGMGHLRSSKTLQGVKFSRLHVDTFSNADMDCANAGGGPCNATIGTRSLKLCGRSRSGGILRAALLAPYFSVFIRKTAPVWKTLAPSSMRQRRFSCCSVLRLKNSVS